MTLPGWFITTAHTSESVSCSLSGSVVARVWYISHRSFKVFFLTHYWEMIFHEFLMFLHFESKVLLAFVAGYLFKYLFIENSFGRERDHLLQCMGQICLLPTIKDLSPQTQGSFPVMQPTSPPSNHLPLFVLTRGNGIWRIRTQNTHTWLH